MSSNEEDVQKSLFSALSCGDSERVEELVNRYGLSYSPDFENGYKLLLNATIFGYKQIVKFLLEKGATVCSKVSHADTPLHFAVWFADFELIRLLIDHKALIDAKDLQYETPLHIACERGHTNVVKLLLNEGANPNVTREHPAKIRDKFCHLKFDQAAFASACQKGHKGFGDLVKYGARTDRSTNRRPLPLLGENDLRDVLENRINRRPLPLLGENDLRDVLENRIYRNSENEGNVTPLHIAAQMGLVEIVELLPCNGAHVNARTSKGSTPLLFAAANGHTDVAKLLLEHGACVNTKDCSNNSPLRLAVVRENTKMVKCLLDGGAVVDDGNPDSLLRYAVGRGLKDIVALFLSAGCDASAKDESGNALIFYSLTHSNKVGKHAETIQLLLDHGADLKEARGLLCKAIIRGDVDVCRTLISNGVDVNAPGDTNIMMSFPAVMPVHQVSSVYQYVKDQYLGCNDHLRFENPLRDANQNLTPLQLACHVGHSAIVELLLNSGANIHARQMNGLTLLHIAAAKGHEHLVETLLKLNVDIDAQGASNETPLHYAVMVNRSTIAPLLLKNGCDVTVESVDGTTAFELVVLKSRSSIRLGPQNGPLFDFGTSMHSFLNRQRQLVIEAFEHHLVKLKAAGMYVPEKMMQLVKFDPNLVGFQQKCEGEVDKIKSETLLNKLTLYSVFMKQRNPQYMRNASAVRILETFDYSKYPLYGNLLLSTFKKSKERIKLLDSGREWLLILLKTRNVLNVETFPIPSVLQLEAVVSYLSKRDLLSLISSGQNLKKQLCQ